MAYDDSRFSRIVSDDEDELDNQDRLEIEGDDKEDGDTDGDTDDADEEGHFLQIDRASGFDNPARDPIEEDERAHSLRQRRDRASRRPWAGPDRMTQTEVSLRLALYFADRGRALPGANIVVALTGHELSRTNSPRFDVRWFLRERGYVTPDERRDWRGIYRRIDRLDGPRRDSIGLAAPPRSPSIVLHNRLGEGDVITHLADGRRLIAEVSGGPLVETRNPADHRLLRGTIGRALTTECAMPSDVICAVVPRSQRMRALIQAWRSAPRLALARLQLLTVDRTGDVAGLE
jgi:hypothetical protein